METTDQLFLEKLLASLSEYKASDMHLVAGNYPILRVDGKLVPLNEEQPLTVDFLKNIVDSWLDKTQKNILERDKEIIFSYAAPNKMRFKVSIYYQQEALSISLKLIPQIIRNLENLGLPKDLEKVLTLKKGLIILVGPFGSGKSTTVAAILNYFNQNETKHILTIEHPIEHIFADNNSVIEQREVGKDTLSFLQGLKFVAEEDIDMVYISQMDSPEVIKQIFEIVDSGRIVITTMTTENVEKTLEAIVNTFPSSEHKFVQTKLAEDLAVINAQKMVPSLTGGQMVASELFFPDDSCRSIIKNGEFDKLRNIINSSQTESMISIDGSLAEHVNNGAVSMQVALENVENKEYFQSLVNKV